MGEEKRLSSLPSSYLGGGRGQRDAYKNGTNRILPSDSVFADVSRHLSGGALNRSQSEASLMRPEWVGVSTNASSPTSQMGSNYGNTAALQKHMIPAM